MQSIEVLRGSDGTFVITFPGTDLSGMDVELFDVAAALQGRLSALISAPEAGQVTLKVDGAVPLPLGKYPFRLRVFQPGSPSDRYLALPPIAVQVQ